MKSSLYIALLPLIALATLSFTACGDRLPTSQDGNQIMPLKVGNRWIARETQLDSSGLEYVITMDTIEIVAVREDPGGEPETTYIDNHGWKHYYLGKELYRSSCDSATASPLVACGPVALYPAAVADTFGTLPNAMVLLPDSNGGNPTLATQVVATRVMATDSTVNVPAGRFSCYHYRPTLIEPVNAKFVTQFDTWYSPGTGLILFERHRESDGKLLYRWELVEYRVG